MFFCFLHSPHRCFLVSLYKWVAVLQPNNQTNNTGDTVLLFLRFLGSPKRCSRCDVHPHVNSTTYNCRSFLKDYKSETFQDGNKGKLQSLTSHFLMENSSGTAHQSRSLERQCLPCKSTGRHDGYDSRLHGDESNGI